MDEKRGDVVLELSDVWQQTVKKGENDRFEWARASNMEYRISMREESDDSTVLGPRDMPSVDLAKVIAEQGRGPRPHGWRKRERGRLLRRAPRSRRPTRRKSPGASPWANSGRGSRRASPPFAPSASLEAYGQDAAGLYQLEYCKKFSIPFGALFFVVLAFPLGLLAKKSGRTMGFGVGILIAVIYWALLLGGQTLGTRLSWSPFWSIWAPNAAVLAAGLALWIARLQDEVRKPHEAHDHPEALSPAHFPAGPLASLGLFALILELVDLFRNLWRYLAQEAPLLSVLKVIWLYLPTAVSNGLPIALLFAAAYSLASLYANNELTVIFGSGVSLASFTIPLFAIAAALCVASFFFDDGVVLRTIKSKNELSQQLSNQGIAEQSGRHRHLEGRGGHLSRPVLRRRRAEPLGGHRRSSATRRASPRPGRRPTRRALGRHALGLRPRAALRQGRDGSWTETAATATGPRTLSTRGPTPSEARTGT